MPFNTKPNDGRKFWMSFVVVTVVILYLGFYLVSTIINTETYLFDNAFAQQQALSNITNSDNSFMIANNNTLSSGNSSDNSPEESLKQLFRRRGLHPLQ